MNAHASISAVWVYWQGGAVSDELRYSMRSVETNFLDLRNIVLCGDKPDWYRGQHIDSPRVSVGTARKEFKIQKHWLKWLDSAVKLQRIIESPLVTDQFLWLYDDTFFVKPVSAEELAIPRVTDILAADLKKSTHMIWREVLRRTAVALQKAGRPIRNFSHHGPVIYDKDQLRETFAKYDPFRNTLAIESLYMNDHYDESQTQPLGDWLEYAKVPRPDWQPSPAASVINLGTFRGEASIVIRDRFPDMSSVEDPAVSLAPRRTSSEEHNPGCESTYDQSSFSESES